MFVRHYFTDWTVTSTCSQVYFTEFQLHTWKCENNHKTVKTTGKQNVVLRWLVTCTRSLSHFFSPCFSAGITRFSCGNQVSLVVWRRFLWVQGRYGVLILCCLTSKWVEALSPIQKCIAVYKYTPLLAKRPLSIHSLIRRFRKSGWNRFWGTRLKNIAKSVYLICLLVSNVGFNPSSKHLSEWACSKHSRSSFEWIR